MKIQAVLFTAAGIGITLLCLLGISWVGPAGAFLNLLTPVAAAYMGMRFGLRSAVVVVAVTSLLLLQLATTYTLVAYLGVFGIGSLLLPWFLRRNIPWDRTLLYVSLGSAIVTGMMVLVTLATTGTGLTTLIDQVIQAEVDQAMQVYRDAGLTGAQLQDMQAVTAKLADFISGSFYGLYVAAVMAVQALCLLILFRLKGRWYRISGTPFGQWRLPAGLIWGLIAAGFSLFVPLDAVVLVGRSLLVVLLPLYFLQGMAVVNSFLQRKTYPPVIKGLIYFLLLALNPLPIVVTSVGVFDLWIDFRRPRQKKI
ncbi:MAG: DUF2232 domain-containing protein [Desulfuromonadales bacterium]|nr:DUF2232 domain-containing protein [Desulfuromonadales bacterium]MBN2792357.1 DUF2232 domain-containing protein [Desulfuromonadales bacterium]